MPSSCLNTVSEDILEQDGISWQSEHQMFVHLRSGTEFAHVHKENGLKVLDVHLHTDAHLYGTTLPFSNIGLLHNILLIFTKMASVNFSNNRVWTHPICLVLHVKHVPLPN